MAVPQDVRPARGGRAQHRRAAHSGAGGARLNESQSQSPRRPPPSSPPGREAAHAIYGRSPCQRLARRTRALLLDESGWFACCLPVWRTTPWRRGAAAQGTTSATAGRQTRRRPEKQFRNQRRRLLRAQEPLVHAPRTTPDHLSRLRHACLHRRHPRHASDMTSGGPWGSNSLHRH